MEGVIIIYLNVQVNKQQSYHRNEHIKKKVQHVFETHLENVVSAI